MDKPIVYIVHAVDCEGPMTEKLEATFERMYEYGLPKYIDVSVENLRKIQEQKLEGIDKKLLQLLSKIFNKHSLDYHNKWNDIDNMMDEILSEKFRNRYCSKNGGPYKYSWFIYDHHEDFSNNPRFHDVGTHKIFDHYFNKFNNGLDGIYWHYHHPSVSGDALESNTCWTNRTTHEEIIAKRIIDRKWYFSCFRAGLHIERNDLSHWLEMFFPFDFSARYMDENQNYLPGSDVDWRGCPSVWGGWHPDWYDYRKEGNMKRYLFRCTDLWTYLNILREEEVEEAFKQAQNNGKSILTYYNHDYRDMKFEIDNGYKVIQKVSNRYPHIDWVFTTALEAAQKYLNLKPQKLKLSYKLEGNLLRVFSNMRIFGPQPFLAIKENNKYFRDNFTVESEKEWAYRFRKIENVEAFGVAANNIAGEFDIIIHRFWSL